MFSFVRASKPNRIKLVNAISQQCACFADQMNSPEKLETFLLENLKIKPSVVQRIILHRTYLSRLINTPAHVLERNWKILHNYNIDINTPHYVSSSLNLNSSILENRILLLQELGATNLTAEMVRSINKYVDLDETTFKKLCNIPSDQSVMENLLRYVNPTPNELAYDNTVQPLSNIPSFKNATVFMQYMHCLEYYRHWKLGCTKFSKKYRNFKCVSFQYLARLVKELNDVGITIDFYKKHPYLLNIHTEDIRRVIDSFKDTNMIGMDIMELIKMYPKVFLLEPDNVKELLEVMKGYEIPEDSIKCCFDILRLSKEEFVLRIEELKTIPELNLWSNHARVSYLIYHFEAVKTRLKMVRNTNMEKWANLYTYTTPKTYFLQYSQGMHNSLPGKYLKYIFASELERKDSSILSEFKKHPNYINVPIGRIVQSIRYLKQYYSSDDICANVHLVLYHRASIEKTLERLNKEYSPENGYHYTPRQFLALCLYMLEKDHNFSGTGVWDVEEYDANANDIDEDTKPYHETDKDNLYVQLMSNFNKQESV